MAGKRPAYHLVFIKIPVFVWRSYTAINTRVVFAVIPCSGSVSAKGYRNTGFQHNIPVQLPGRRDLLLFGNNFRVRINAGEKV